MKKKNMGSYYCKKCKHEHKLNSKIGKKHKKHKRRGLRKKELEKLESKLNEIESSLKSKDSKKNKKTSYYCKKCKRKHKKNTKIEKKHKKHKKKTKKEKNKEKLNFLKRISKKIKKKDNLKDKIKKKIKKAEDVSKTTIVKEIMVRNPVHVKKTSSLSSAFELMKKYNLKSIIVTENKKPIGILNEEEILSFFSSFVRMEKGALENNKKILDKLSKQNVFAAMIKTDDVLKKTDSLEKVARIMITKKLDQLPVVDSSGKIVGIVFNSDILSYIDKKTLDEEKISTDVIETNIDKLYEMVKLYGEITAKKISKKLNISEKQVEDWAKILEEHGLIEIDYSTIGTIKLIKKEKKFF